VIEAATQPWMFETMVCSSLEDASGALDEHEFAVVFCEERCGEGTYRDLLSLARARKVPVVLMISDPSREAAVQEAMTLGTFGVITDPCSRKDVQWMVIRATQGKSHSRLRFNSRGGPVRK